MGSPRGVVRRGEEVVLQREEKALQEEWFIRWLSHLEGLVTFPNWCECGRIPLILVTPLK